MPDVPGQHDVLGPLVGRVAQRRHPQHHELALARRERRREEDVAVEGVEGLGERRIVRQRAERIQGLRSITAPVGERVPRDGRLEHRQRLAHLARPLLGGDRGDSR